MMGIKLADKMKALPKAERDAVMARAAEIQKEIDDLRSLRKAATKTQVEIAKGLGVSQPSVAKIESQTDMYLSTLQKYVEAAGAKLTLVVELENGQRVRLKGLADIRKSRLRATRARENSKPIARAASRARVHA